MKAALVELVPVSQLEQGCLQYDFLEPLQGNDEFLVLMRWETQEALSNHEASKHIKEVQLNPEKCKKLGKKVSRPIKGRTGFYQERTFWYR